MASRKVAAVILAVLLNLGWAISATRVQSLAPQQTASIRGSTIPGGPLAATLHSSDKPGSRSPSGAYARPESGAPDTGAQMALTSPTTTNPPAALYDGGTLNLASAPFTNAQFNPLYFLGVPEATSLMFNGLLGTDANLNLTPALAERYELSADQRSLTFYLRPGISWHDGQPLTAQDVVFTLQTILHPDYSGRFGPQDLLQLLGAEAFRSGQAASVSGIQVVDNLTIRLTTEQPHGPLLTTLAMIPVIPRHRFEGVPVASLESHPNSGWGAVGTGPFKLAGYNSPNQYVELVRNDSYFLGQPQIGRVLIWQTWDWEQRLRSGRLDLFNGRPRSTWTAEELNRVTALEQPGNVIQWMGVNHRNPLLADVRVRKAIAQAVDRESVVTDLLGGKGVVIHGAFIPASWAYDPAGLQTYSFDLAAAQTQLEQAGFTKDTQGFYAKNGQRLEFSLTYPSSGNMVRVQSATRFKQSLEQAGIKINLDATDFPSLIKKVFEDYTADLWLIALSSGGTEPDPRDLFLPEPANPANWANAHNWQAPTNEQMLNDGVATVDPAMRKALYHNWEVYMSGQVPVLPLYSPNNPFTLNKRVTGHNIGRNTANPFWNIHQWSLSDASPSVRFPDANLERAIRMSLPNASGDLTPAMLSGLTQLSGNSRGISNLAGMEYLTGLQNLYLWDNKIQDITPLAGLTLLEELDLWKNEIGDIGPLQNLANLRLLGLGRNHLTDLSPLSSLIALQQFYVQENQISSLSPLSGLSGLQTLFVWGNQLTSLDPIANLTGLQELDFGFNQISDLTPLTNLTALTSLAMGGNQISSLSLLAGRTGLVRLWAWGNQITDLGPVSTLTGLQGLDVGGNPLTSAAPVAGLNGLVILSLADTPISDLTPVSGLTNLQKLFIWGMPVSDLTPLANLTALEYLWAWENPISDIAPLAGLTNLKVLSLWDTQITDLTPLTGLTQLQELNLGIIGTIESIETLSGLTNLRWLQLGGNQITDLAPLAGMTLLQDLYAWGNQVSDLSPLQNLNELRTLHVDNNSLTSIEPLSGLTGLISLGFGGNSIHSFAPLGGLYNLRHLYAWDTGLDDADAVFLSGLKQLVTLHLAFNRIRSTGFLQDLSLLEELWLYDNQISDNLAGLSNLVHLRTVGVEYNRITDLGALVANSGIGMDDFVGIRNNYLNLAPGTKAAQDLDTLVARGAVVESTPQNTGVSVLIQLEGRPYDGTGAQVTLTGNGYSETLQTEADGLALFPVSAAGTYTLQVTRFPFLGYEKTITLAPTGGSASNAFLYAGDIDQDGDIDVVDLTALTTKYGTPHLDFDIFLDGQIDLMDLIPVARNVGRTK